MPLWGMPLCLAKERTSFTHTLIANHTLKTCMTPPLFIVVPIMVHINLMLCKM
jgi:hypothetical protein